MQIAVGLKDIHAAGRVKRLAETHALAADQGLRRPQRGLHIGETADRVGIRARQAHHRAGVAQAPVVGDRVGETAVVE